ncbi:hypothetical protein O6H91_21G035500 [Diphasiastrum complanatum]|uniref:Uncharacterized protein n=1 Tax=Diphasiastrum complanatum TaxID=34168 RepID=A0ACC2AJG6_DIPCM|nr:hypothetical protein O6H91_21G035500 [Diphasiastrum complanatum]
MPVYHGLRARSKHLLSRHLGGSKSSFYYSHLTTFRSRTDHAQGIATNAVPKPMPNRTGSFWNFTQLAMRLQTHKQVAVAAGTRQLSTSREISSADKSEASGAKRNDLFIRGGLVVILLTALGVLEYKERFVFKRTVAKKPAEFISQFEQKSTVKDENLILNRQSENKEQSVASNENHEQSAEHIEEPESLESKKLSENNVGNDLHSEHKDLDGLQSSEEKRQFVEDKITPDEASNLVTNLEDAEAATLDSFKESEKSAEDDAEAHVNEKDIQDVVRNAESHEVLRGSENSTPPEPETSNAPREVLELATSTSDAQHIKEGALSETYLLQKGHEDNVKRYLEGQKEETSDAVLSDQSVEEKIDGHNSEVVGDAGRSSKDDKPAIDIVAAIHAAEQRQAQIDAAAFVEQLQNVEDRYQRELKDVRAKMLMYAEHAKRLQQEEASKLKQEETQLLAKVEALAAFVEEKVAFLKELGDVKLQVEALHAAFNARSEEARQSHTVHKLALGTFSLEDAMLRGDPVQKEVALVLESAGGPGTDPLVYAAVMSLPAEAIKDGTRTPVELQEKFSKIRRQLSELALIPVAGGGVLTHALAWLASSLKVSEEGSRDANNGIEAVLGQVALFLAEGKLAEAADALERGSTGTKAQKLAGEWAREVRHRVVMEQACSVLRAHSIATSLSFF